MEKLLTTYQVTEILGVHHVTVGHWCDKGKLKSLRTVGGHRRISAEDVKRFLKENDPEGIQDESHS